MTAFEDLLEVQDHDTAADRLRHRLESLPERADLAARELEMATIDQQLSATEPQRNDLTASQRRLEDELATTETKIVDADKRLYSGTVGSPRELQALQADIGSLKRHRGDLEDRLIDVMAEQEPLDADALELLERRSGLEAEAEKLRSLIDEASATIDADLSVEVDARNALAAGLPERLVTLYEQLRQKLGGVGVARLDHGSCGGCHMALPATELDAIRHQAPEAIVRCDQCGRILVR